MLSRWFGMNYLQLNGNKTHAVASGKSLYEHEFHFDDSRVETRLT